MPVLIKHIPLLSYFGDIPGWLLSFISLSGTVLQYQMRRWLKLWLPPIFFFFGSNFLEICIVYSR